MTKDQLRQYAIDLFVREGRRKFAVNKYQERLTKAQNAVQILTETNAKLVEEYTELAKLAAQGTAKSKAIAEMLSRAENRINSATKVVRLKAQQKPGWDTSPLAKALMKALGITTVTK